MAYQVLFNRLPDSPIHWLDGSGKLPDTSLSCCSVAQCTPHTTKPSLPSFYPCVTHDIVCLWPGSAHFPHCEQQKLGGAWEWGYV